MKILSCLLLLMAVDAHALTCGEWGEVAKKEAMARDKGVPQVDLEQGMAVATWKRQLPREELPNNLRLINLVYEDLKDYSPKNVQLVIYVTCSNPKDGQ